MSQADALKRLELLEARARYTDIRPMAEEAAEKLGFNVDELIAEAQRLAQRVEEIGFPAVQAAVDAEAAWIAELCGVSVEDLYADVDQFFARRDWSPFGAAW